MQWISVEDRLPQYTDTYIVCCNIGSMLGCFKSVRAYRYEHIKGELPKWVIPKSFDEVISISHWMPMPSPPEDEENRNE